MRQEDGGIRMGLICCKTAGKQQGDLVVRSIAELLSAHRVDLRFHLSFKQVSLVKPLCRTAESGMKRCRGRSCSTYIGLG